MDEYETVARIKKHLSKASELFKMDLLTEINTKRSTFYVIHHSTLKMCLIEGIKAIDNIKEDLEDK